VQPTAYDLLYCALLGYGVKQLFDQGCTGCMVTADYTKGTIKPLYLEDVSDENGKVIPRLVDIDGEKQKLIFRHGMQYIGPADYEAAREYLEHPEEFDMINILNW
jgi:6-phosphofructokinase 1